MTAIAPTKRELSRIRRLRVDQGMSLRDIAERMGRSMTWVRDICIREGFHEVTCSLARWTDRERQLALELRAAGLTYKQIGQRLGRSVDAVGSELRRQRDAARAAIDEANRILAKAQVRETRTSLVRRDVPDPTATGGMAAKPPTVRPDSRTDADRIGHLAERGFTPEGIARTFRLDIARVREVLRIRDAQREAAMNARRDGTVRLEGMALRRARSLLAQGWSDPDVARHVRVSVDALREALA